MLNNGKFNINFINSQPTIIRGDNLTINTQSSDTQIPDSNGRIIAISPSTSNRQTTITSGCEGFNIRTAANRQVKVNNPTEQGATALPITSVANNETINPYDSTYEQQLNMLLLQA